MYFGIFGIFLHEVNYVFAQVLVLQSVLAWLFPLVVVTVSFGDVTTLFIVIYLFSLRESGRLFA
jgi:hypothetical protein